MRLQPQGYFHLYNRGNNRGIIFFRDANYRYFIRKLRRHVAPHVHLLAYCLMPNHFHLLIETREDAEVSAFTESFRVMLSSYTRGINRQEGRTGSLFTQNTRSKNLQEGSQFYGLACFCYIHQNPLRAGLASDIDAWPYSSYLDYAGARNESICSVSRAKSILNIPTAEQFRRLMAQTLPDRNLQHIW